MENLSSLIAKSKIWGLAGIISFVRREANARFLRRKLQKLHVRSKTTDPQPGITVVGDLTEHPGLSKTLRDLVWSLKDADIPVQTFDTTWRPRIPAADMDGLITPKEEFDLHRYTHIVMMYRSPLTKEMTKGHVVGRIVFHDSAHGIHVVTPFLRESGDDIIAMSDFNYEYFKTAFPDQRVWKITYPFRFREKTATPREVLRRKFGIGANDFVVFFNFDFGSYYRKNIPAALSAFAMAFQGDPTARLVFKTMGAKRNGKQVAEMTAKVRELGLESQFLHISEYLPKADVDGLTGASDVYLSLHKCEGFGQGIAEAMSQGKPVVVTGWSANLEFCRPETAWCVPYRIVPIQPHEYPPAMMEWAEADAEAAAKALLEIRANPAAARERAERGKAFVEDHFSVANFKRDVTAFLGATGHG